MKSVEKLLTMVTNKEVAFSDLSEMDISAIKEIGNILRGSYLNALNRLPGLSLIQSVPACAIDMAGAILSSSMIPLSKTQKILESLGFELG